MSVDKASSPDCRATLTVRPQETVKRENQRLASIGQFLNRALRAVMLSGLNNPIALPSKVRREFQVNSNA